MIEYKLLKAIIIIRGKQQTQTWIYVKFWITYAASRKAKQNFGLSIR
jgi:hypothetical protein